MKRLVRTKQLADQWRKLGYEVVALSFFPSNGAITFHLEKKL